MPDIGVPSHHADISGGWLRAAVFGAMDGLVTNIALIAGVGGAGVSSEHLLLTGVAGLVAGACSMALGEYTSVRTSNEQVAAELAKERLELDRNPAGERMELIALLRQRGISRPTAVQIADEVSDDPELALRLHAQEELGVVPGALPSPYVAAGSSFVCFAAGALIPILPFLFGVTHVGVGLAVGGVGLFAVGAAASAVTAGRWWLAGLRQLVLGAAAAGVTYVVGVLLGGLVS